MNQLGGRIRALRTARKMTQDQLAIMAEVDGTMINKIENGKSPGSVQTLTRIAVAFGMSLAQLLSDEQAATTERKAV